MKHPVHHVNASVQVLVEVGVAAERRPVSFQYPAVNRDSGCSSSTPGSVKENRLYTGCRSDTRDESWFVVQPFEPPQRAAVWLRSAGFDPEQCHVASRLKGAEQPEKWCTVTAG